MWATRVLITAINDTWARHACQAMCGFATSVIDCGVEAGVERVMAPDETPDGRPGYAVLLFAMSLKGLEKQLLRRVGQTVMTCATTACYAGMDGREAEAARMTLGGSLRYFADGYQIAKYISDRRYWRIPVMHGEFLCEESCWACPAIGGGNFLVFAETVAQGLKACEQAVEAMAVLPDIITPFPGGVVGSGSKVGSRYCALRASTNERYCPSLKGQVDTALNPEVGAVLELVIDGVDQASIQTAMRAGILAACSAGRESGVCGVSAAQYGGHLGTHRFLLREVLAG